VKKKYWWRTHKFGCKFPHSVEEALEIDRHIREAENLFTSK
jgi:hypothetical protein